jgi:hypothetical protein
MIDLLYAGLGSRFIDLSQFALNPRASWRRWPALTTSVSDERWRSARRPGLTMVLRQE